MPTRRTMIQQTGCCLAAAFATSAPKAQDKAITIGSTAALTGPLAGFGLGMKAGVATALAQINAKGGIHGRPLRFALVDDGYSVERSLSNVRQLLADGSPLAFLSCFGTPNNAAIIPVIEEAGVPYVAPFSGASSLRKASMRNVFHVRVSYTEETTHLVRTLVAMYVGNIAIAYTNNPFGMEVLAGARQAFAAAGIKALAEVPVEVDGSDAAQAAAKLVAASPAAVMLGTTGLASVTLAKAVREKSPRLPLAGLSATFTQEGLASLGASGSGIALTMVFPDHRAAFRVVRDFQAAQRATKIWGGSLEAYVNTLVLAEGLERAGPGATHAKLRAALAGIRGFDVGGLTVDYAQAPYVGSKYVDIGVVNASGKLVV
jgi:branched-chain amino acid transport system substrate-binding protein